jgi:hypothetical protein
MDATTTPPPSDQLAQALTELTRLLLTTPDVERVLDEAARLATAVVSAPVDCGITWWRGEEPVTVADSGALAVHVDEQQYAAGDGPSLEALRTGRPVSVTDLAGERRWNGYAAHALACGVRSSLSLRDASQHRNMKLREVAALIVTAASGSPPAPPTPFHGPHRLPRP